MKSSLPLDVLIKLPTFGANKITKVASENLAASQFLDYTLLKDGKVARFTTLYPNVLNPELPLRKFVEVTNDLNVPAIKKLFEDLENGVFIHKGEVRGDELKEAVLPIRIKHLEDKLSYGTNPKLVSVSRGTSARACVTFTALKNGKTQKHNALVALADISKEIIEVPIIPKSLFSSYREFNALMEDLLQVEPGRLLFRQDPSEVDEDYIDVYVNPSDLVYQGKLRIMLPLEGTTTRLVSPFDTSGEVDDGANAGAEYDLKISFNETNIDTNNDHAGYANPGDMLYLHIRATGLVRPQKLDLVLTAVDGPSNITLEDTTVTVPTNGLLTIPLMYDSTIADASTTALAMVGVAIVGSSRSLDLLKVATVPAFTAGSHAEFMPVGTDFGVYVTQTTPKYTPRNVVWSSVPGGATFVQVSPDMLAMTATLPNTLSPDDTVVISVNVDGVVTTLGTTTVV